MATQILAKRISDWAPIEIIVQPLDDIQCICGMINQEDKESFVLENVYVLNIGPNNVLYLSWKN